MSHALRFPSERAVDTAVAWLRCNDGDDGEAEDCAAVADWLEHQAKEARVRKIARETGFPVKTVRKLLAEDTGP